MDIVTPQQRQKIHPHKFLMWVAIGSIVMMFAGLTSAYIVKSNQANWIEVQLPKLFFASTAVILASSITMQMALRNFKQREMKLYRVLLFVTLALGAAFVVLQWFAFTSLWNEGIHFKGASAAQFLYIIAGLHAIHVIGGIIALLVMGAKAFLSNTRNYNSIPVEVMATYWHFVDLLWIYLLVFFLLIR